MIRIASFAVLFVLSFAVPAYAQFDVGEDISLSMNPLYPAPGETVRIEVRGSADLEAQDITWYVNGEKFSEGAGLRNINVAAGKLGSETRVGIALGGVIAAAEIVIRPVEVDLLWESDSYIPPFYRGRALPSAGTGMYMQALVRFKYTNGASVPKEDVVYTWRKNGYVIQSVSGRAKSEAFIPSPALFGKDVLSVRARSIDGAFEGEASVQIPSVEPELVLYEDSPLFGIMYHRAFGVQTAIPQTEATFAAVPYYADAQHPDDSRLVYDWSVNTSPVASDSTKRSEITINAEGSNGRALIELVLSSATNFFLKSSGSWAVSLADGGGGIFGTNPFGSSGQ